MSELAYTELYDEAKAHGCRLLVHLHERKEPFITIQRGSTIVVSAFEMRREHLYRQAGFLVHTLREHRWTWPAPRTGA